MALHPLSPSPGRPESETTHPMLPRHGTDVPSTRRRGHSRHHEDIRTTEEPAVHQEPHRCHHARLCGPGHAGVLFGGMDLGLF